MSDYEVTLVNDNSEYSDYCHQSTYTNTLSFQCTLPLMPLSPTISDELAVDINVIITLGKNFTSTSKAPKRVCTRPAVQLANTEFLQHLFRAVTGRSTLNYQINTHTRVLVSVSSTAFSIRILMNCKYFLPTVEAVHQAHILSSSGSVCLDVINQTWSPMYDMINIFEVFLPQLLRYPNPSDPLNGEAAAMLMRDPKNYENKVRGLSLYPAFEIPY